MLANFKFSEKCAILNAYAQDQHILDRQKLTILANNIEAEDVDGAIIGCKIPKALSM